MDTTILVERRDAYAVVTLNRPDKLNAFIKQMHEELSPALEAIGTDPSVRAVLLTGTGRGFCAGQDLEERLSSFQGDADLGMLLDQYLNRLARAVTAIPVPVVCAVNGVAAGAGSSLALGCDIVLAARSARFVQSFCKVGLIPDGGGTFALPRRVGEARARGLALLGDPISAQQAAEWGLIWMVVDDDALMDEAHRLVAHLASAPTQAMIRIKRALRASLANDWDAQLDLERDLQHECGETRDYREAVHAFVEKRLPRFVGA
ncbi:MAG: 2-(1,2-epoxy-1,2-dihydrophenyl)acetyl-CoA isomerase [Hyphomicrobiales bacterium]|nr:2-(1,2-epoxy-1,2-dihydrophenyl)acetyl-CoA isomerase [Hyphomicrobiales bacterium]